MFPQNDFAGSLGYSKDPQVVICDILIAEVIVKKEMPESSGGGAKLLLKTCRRHPAEDGMGTHGILEGFQIGEHIGLSLNAGGVLGQVDQLTFEVAEEILGYGVGIWGAPAGHALEDTYVSRCSW